MRVIDIYKCSYSGNEQNVLICTLSSNRRINTIDMWFTAFRTSSGDRASQPQFDSSMVQFSHGIASVGVYCNDFIKRNKIKY